jgi:hypothetical protein
MVQPTLVAPVAVMVVRLWRERQRVAVVVLLLLC